MIYEFEMEKIEKLDGLSLVRMKKDFIGVRLYLHTIGTYVEPSSQDTERLHSLLGAASNICLCFEVKFYVRRIPSTIGMPCMSERC